MGTDRVSCWARCFRPRAWRAVPSSVQSRPARGRGGGQLDAAPAAAGKVAVALAEHHRLRRAQGRVVQAGVEGFQVGAAVAEGADGGEQGPGLGGAGDDAPVEGLGDGGGFPLDAVDRVGGQQPQLDGVADGVVEHGPLAPLGRGGGWCPGAGAGAGAQREPDGGGVVLQCGDRQ